MMNKNKLSGLAQGTFVDGWMFLQKTMVKTASNNNQYLSMQGRDINGVLISVTLYKNIDVRHPQDSIVRVVGDVGDPKYQYTVYAKEITLITDPNDIQEFRQYCLPKVPPDQLTQIMTDLEAYANCFQNPGILQLSRFLWGYFRPYLTTRPGGVRNHEPLIGGLALHSWQVVSLVNNALFIPSLDRDVLLFSALYHDIGKSQEYTDDLRYTPTGRLFGHISIGLELIHSYMMQVTEELPEVQLKHIKHCILTHHGKDAGYDKPCTREANVVHHADLLMATLGGIEEKIRSGTIGDDGWGTYDENLKTTVFVPQLIKAKT